MAASTHSQALAWHLESVAPTVTSPWHYIALVYAYLASLAGRLIDTPEERAGIENAVLTQYDKLVLSFAQSNPAIASLFMAMRSTVKDSLDWILVSLAPAPAPTPGPQPVPLAPAGAAP